MTPPSPTAPARPLLVGLLSFAAGLALRLVLLPLLGSQFGFMFFIPAVGISAWFGGRSAGLLTTLLSAVVVWYWWLPEFGSFRIEDRTTGFHLVAFVVVGTGMAYFLAEGRRALLALRAAQASEAALRQDYEVTLRSIGDAVIATDRAGRITFMNAVAERLTGWSFSVARGKPIDTIFVIIEEGTRAPVSSPVRRVLADNAIIGLQNHTLLITRAGDEIPISDSAAPIFGIDGELRGVVLVFHDMVEQASARRALRSANAALEQQITDLRRLQEWSWTVYRTSAFEPMLQQVLHAALEIHGADKGLLSLVTSDGAGLNVAASHGFSAGFVRQIQTVAPGEGACGWCHLTRQRVVVEDVDRDPRFERYRSVAKAGGFRAVHSTPLSTREGKLIGVLSVHFNDRRHPTEREMRLMDLYARNVADLIENAQLRQQLQRELEVRRATAEELRITNERFKLAAHGETLTLFEQDDALRYRWVYPTRADFAHAVGRTDEELIGAVDGAPIAALKREVLVTGRVSRAEVKATRPSGTHYYELTVSPKRNVAGEIDGVSGAAFDITVRKEAELALVAAKEELARINQELEHRVRERTASLTDLLAQMETFSYTISHDLRSPLRAIVGFAEALKEDHGGRLDESGRDLLDRIMRGGERMSRLISDVLAYARVNRDRVDRVPVSVEDAVRQVVQHAPELQPPRAIIRMREPLPHVLGNESFLTQVLANVLGNAVKFVPEGRTPQVEITGERHGEFVRLTIADNGIGIKPEYQARLFGLFERLNVNKRYEGTGMGLAIVRRAVERMGGTVGVESDGEHGTRIWLDLPAAPAALNGASATTSAAPLREEAERRQAMTG